MTPERKSARRRLIRLARIRLGNVDRSDEPRVIKQTPGNQAYRSRVTQSGPPSTGSLATRATSALALAADAHRWQREGKRNRPGGYPLEGYVAGGESTPNSAVSTVLRKRIWICLRRFNIAKQFNSLLPSSVGTTT